MSFILPARIETGYEIGRGGFAVVLQGVLKEANGLHKEVALKCVLPGSTRHQETLLMREALNTIKLSQRCPNTVQCYGFSVMDGHACLVMQLYKGGTLQSLLQEHLDDPLPPLARAQIAKDIVEAVWQLHGQGFIAEDLKPGNVLLDGNKRAHLCDFGGSKSLGSYFHTVVTKEAIGTAFFMPPEKLRKGAGSEQFHVGYASDVWSLGVLLLQLACCNLWLPYGPGVDVSNVASQLLADKEPPAVPPLPDMPGMQHLIRQCLQLEPSARIKIKDLAKGIEGVLRQIRQRTDASPGDSAATDGLMERQQQRPAAERPVMLQESTCRELCPQQATSATHARKPQVARDIGAIFASMEGQSELNLDLRGAEVALQLAGNLPMPLLTQLHNGSIVLPEHTKVCFEDGCHAHLVNVSIHGAHNIDCAVEIHGHTRVRMDDVHVEGGGIGDAAAVRVDGGGKGSSKGQLIARSSSFSSRGHGLQVQGGGGAQVIEGTRCDGNGGCGWVVRDEGSSLEARSGSSSSWNEQDNAQIFGGGRAYFAESRLEGSKGGFGVAVSGSRNTEKSIVSIRSSSLNSNQLSNASVRKWARAEMLGCCLDNSKGGCGLACFDPHSSVKASLCSLSSNLHSTRVCSGGRAELWGCCCDGNKGSGLSVVDSGSAATASVCRFWGNHQNVCAGWGAKLEVREGCHFEGGRAGGMAAFGLGSSATASQCSISSNHQNVGASWGAKVDLCECLCDHSNSGEGVRAVDPGSSATAKKCSISGNALNVSAEQAGRVHLQDCQCCGSKGSGLLAVGRGSSAVARACRISSNVQSMACENALTHSVSAERAGRIYLQDCQCCDSRSSGLLALGQDSSATAFACTISANEGDNTRAEGGGRLVLWNGCRCDHGLANGLRAVGLGSTAKAWKCSLSNNQGSNVCAEEGGKAEALLCLCDSAGCWGFRAVGVSSCVDTDTHSCSSAANSKCGRTAESSRGAVIVLASSCCERAAQTEEEAGETAQPQRTRRTKASPTLPRCCQLM